MDKRTFLDCTGGVLIGICILGLVGAFAYSCFLFSKKNVQDVNIQIVMKVDSTGVLTEDSKQQVDKMKEEIIRHEQLLEDRYKHVLEQKENMNDMLTIGGMFLTIVLALFGFFGYKSMNTLEDKVKADAKSAAEDAAKESFEKKFESYAQTTTDSLKIQMGSDVKETVGKEMAEYKKTTKKQLETKIGKDINDKYDDIRSEVDAVSTSLGNLDEKIAVLNSRVDKLSANETQQERKRRTLASGGKKV